MLLFTIFQIIQGILFFFLDIQCERDRNWCCKEIAYNKLSSELLFTIYYFVFVLFFRRSVSILLPFSFI